MKEASQNFKNMVDNMIDLAQHDPELLDGIQWLDKRSFKEGVSFYDKVYELLGKRNAEDKAKQWIKERNNQ